VVGQEVYVPDISNIQGDGMGIFGAMNLQMATSRVVYLPCNCENDSYSYSPGASAPGYGKQEETDFDSLFVPPTLVRPEDGVLLEEGGALSLSWQSVEGASHYILVVKPHYLWFWPGNYATVPEENELSLSWQDVPCRDCELEWYVKAIDTVMISDSKGLFRNPADDNRPFQIASNIFAVPPDKGPMVVNGYRWSLSYSRFISDSHSRQSYGGRVIGFETPWSESRSIITRGGEMPGFEGAKPVVFSPSGGETISVFGKLTWQEISGADLYLLYLSSNDGEVIIAVTDKTEIVPPFPDNSTSIDGLRGVEAFEPGVTYTWQVCALRVKSGLLGFRIIEDNNGELPEVHPRYEHPSGIMLQSRWSDAAQFTVQ
jgi:hypothetical protein